MKRVKNGFTLIELMVVIAIIAILSAVAYIFYLNVQRNARDSKRVQDIQAVAKALEVRASTTDSPYYPKISPDFFTTKALPKDPSTGTDYNYIGTTLSSGGDYFILCSTLE